MSSASIERVRLPISLYLRRDERYTNAAYIHKTLRPATHLKCRSLNEKCVSTMPVVFTRDLNTSCSVGT